MNSTPETQSLINNPCTVIVPPNIMVMMSGVRMAKVAPDMVTLCYTDGTEESAVLTREESAGDFFSLVAAVQSYRNR